MRYLDFKLIFSITILSLLGLVSPAFGYEFFTSRTDWLEATEDLSTVLEDFNSISDGIYEQNELPTNVFSNTALVLSPYSPPGSLINGRVNISEGSIIPLLNIDFTVQLTFDRNVNPIFGAGFDVNSSDPYQYALLGFDSSGNELFEFESIDLISAEFIGWVAEEGDSPVFTMEIFTDRAESYDNLTVMVVPEPLTILGAGIAVAFGTGFKRKLAKTKKK